MPVVPLTVTFAWHADMRQGPLATSRFHAPVLGRLGLLELLELHLGLAGPLAARSQRVAAYLRHLRHHNTASRFYARSLQADEMGVASELLRWRDEWLLHGWNGSAANDAPLRVRDLGLVEGTAWGHIPAGEAERLARVEAALADRGVPIEALVCLDVWERLPRRWQRVLTCLPLRVDAVAVPKAAATSSALAMLQRGAAAATQSGAIHPLQGVTDDSSVQVYQCVSSDAALHWLSARSVADPLTELIVCERDGMALDNILRARGEPVCGFDRNSGFRPALQALPLALELLWRPIDVNRVLEFLTHAYGPFSRRARQALARAFADQPGYGGAAWRTARELIGARDGGAAILTQIDFWFGDERWTREAGAPLAAVEERVEAVVSALRVLMDRPRDDGRAVAAGIRQGQALLAALAELNSQGITRLTPRHLEHLLAEATVSGTGNPYAQPQAGCRRSTMSSALATLEPADDVLWWMPSRPTLPRPHPWSEAELAALRSADAEIPDMAIELRALAQDWLRPLLSARQRFTLVLPPTAEEEHPVTLLVRGLLPHLPVRPLEKELVIAAGEVVRDRPLPALQRTYRIAADMRSRRPRQSFTSLTELYNHPAVSVLNDAAALRGATLMAVEENNRLFGTLAHRLVENLFGHADALTWDSARVRTWFGESADELIAAEGAPLLMRGFGVVLHRFKAVVREATVALLEHLRAAGVVRVRTEVELEGTLFGDVPVSGKVDLLADLPDGDLAILDLKWSGMPRYRERLTGGTHLQLAIYAALVEQVLQQAPAELAFFIFDSRTLLTASNRHFTAALCCPPPPGCSVPELIARAHASWRWRREQLGAGELEVVDLRLEGLEAFQGPPGTLPVQETGPWHAEYVALLGWEAGA